MDYLAEKYEKLCETESDINEHLPTLFKYSKECESIMELGVRGVVSTWAFSYGLLCNEKEKKKLFLNDITECDIQEIINATNELDIDVSYEWKNDLELEINEMYDMIFIDTWHIYGQLKRELEKFSKISNKYIIMHDTTGDEILGETVRLCMNSALIYSSKSGTPVSWNMIDEYLKNEASKSDFTSFEVCRGLWPAVEEFLENNSNWKIKERYTNNNGLTILEKIS